MQAKDDFPIILNVCQAKIEIQLKTVTLMAHFAVLMMGSVQLVPECFAK
jgi:hypothetical protein